MSRLGFGSVQNHDWCGFGGGRDGLELGCPGGACVFLVSRIDRGNGNGESGHGAEWSVCLCVGNGQGKGILGILILQM